MKRKKEEDEIFMKDETPSKRKKMNDEKENIMMMKKKNTPQSERKLKKRKSIVKENKTGKVKDLRMQFEGIAASIGRFDEERKAVVDIGEVVVEKAAKYYQIGESSIVDQSVNRGRDRVTFLRDKLNGPIGRDNFWRENGQNSNQNESN